MNKNNITIKELEKLLAYCDNHFHTRKISVIECLNALAGEVAGESAGADVYLHAVVNH